MGLGDALARLAGDACKAAFDDRSWDGWLSRAGETLGAKCAAFYIVDRETADIRRQIIQHPEPATIERYRDEGIWRLDPQVPFVARLAGSALYRDTDHLDDADPNTREYLRWQQSNGDLRHYMTASIAVGQYCAGISLHRAVADGATPDETVRAMEVVFPAIRDALELGLYHADKLTAHYWDGVLTRRAEPAMLLDERCRALRATPAIEALFAAADGLDCRGGRLRVDEARAQGALDAMLARIVAGGEGSAVPIRRRSGRAPYIVSAYPLARPVRTFAPLEAAALVTVVDPCGPGTPSSGHWRAAFGFSAREADVAAALMQGHSVESAAAALGIAASTARLHMRRLFARTGTVRQAELIRLLARI